ncbi:hypothetical protein [Phytoactinopolyspora halotolerans]|uniref:Uncharacterized protein n=1 Tax=Phytoactinopolyspora halotolerans TaxID=1981512 RepID=A0A6L9SBX7_9ACTN|nr:hypothetical protein [Phytoactinopolyspora halotolerans]NEE02583.1 hypothetical protein [Phytoactinopolyspora halotolerans]
MRHVSGCSRQRGPAGTLAASWLAHLHGDYTQLDDLIPPPGVDAVLETLAEASPSPERIAEALTTYAWDSISDNSDLTCALDDVDALWSILESNGHPPISRNRARHIVTDAWVDAVAANRASPGIDALSGLHTMGYLLGRISELDRLTDDEAAPLVVLVVTWHEPASPWERISCILQVASALQDRVRAEATLSQFGTHCAVALVPDDNRARLERGSLTKRLNTGELSTFGFDVDLIPLPENRSHVTELIVRLQDGSMVGDKSGPIGRFPHDWNSLD